MLLIYEGILTVPLKVLRELVLHHRHKHKSCTTKFNSIFRLGTLILYMSFLVPKIALNLPKMNFLET
jgi:hypothetical protein